MIFLLLSFIQVVHASASLNLESFLKQVIEKNDSIKSSSIASKASLLRLDEVELMTAPNLFANAQYLSDKKITPFFGYSEYRSDSYNLGISQLTTFGLQGKLYYNINSYQYMGLPAGRDITPNPYYQGRPVLELTQSLWRNGFGAETRALKNQAISATMVTHYTESFKVKAAMADAESAYWRLALARENVLVQKSALDRSQKIYEWSARRSRLQLADPSDQLQAQAALELRKLQFQAAVDDERSAARSFNMARSIDSDRVEEVLETLDADLIHSMKAPERVSVRDDVRIAEYSSHAAVAQAQASIEADSPTFEVYGSFALNSSDSNYADAFRNSFTLNQPTVAVGIRFSTPLYFGAAANAKQALGVAQIAAETSYQRKSFEQEQEWKDLTQKFEDTKKRYELSRTIEQVQQKKLLHEKERLNRGRTTTFQVLQFEQEYAQAQLVRIQSQADVLQIIARMKLFGGSPL